ncbi:homeobox protein VENTX-like [Carettochelys insculpta]|uniref:homeobox protein VENTX-like n=1 Tax=Carettochelys insculpta TaxID=44489 RepID=UPI003EB9017D
MTKAPFSVEWLSQSSAHGFFPQRGNPSSASPQPPQGRKGGRLKPLDAPSEKEPGRETLLDSSACRAAPAWSAAEPGSRWGSGRAECPSPEAPGAKAGRRLRTAFSLEQLSTLESSFKRHKYLGAAERRKLAAKMQLSEVQIKTWFQNRRMKLKRQLQEMRPEPLAARGGPLPLPLPLHYLYLAQLPAQEAGPASFPLPALPAAAWGPYRREPGGFWQPPCFVGYRDPRAFLLPI